MYHGRLRISIRPYQPSDLEACRALWVELTHHHHQLYNDPTIGGDDPGSNFDRHLERVGMGRIWVAEKDKKVIGMVGLLIYAQEAEVEPMIVSRRYRRKGVGERLLRRAVAEARQLNVRYLNVRPVARNVDAMMFFFQVGFRLLGKPELFMDLEQPVG